MKKKLFQLALALPTCTIVTMATSTNAIACTDPDHSYLGTVCTTAAKTCPRGYLPANGKELPIANNQVLYAVIGTTFGGNGRSTFALPDLRGRSPVGAGSGPGLSHVALGARRGREEVYLNTLHLPSHNHEAIFTPSSTSHAASVVVSTQPGTKDTPSDGDYLGVGKSGLTSVKQYVPQKNAAPTVRLGGVSGGLGTDGTIIVTNTGNSQPFYIIPPQQALTYCVNTTGLFPPKF
ncbi:MAG: phage tail protein [Pontibacterium sp.]